MDFDVTDALPAPGHFQRMAYILLPPPPQRRKPISPNRINDTMELNSSDSSTNKRPSSEDRTKRRRVLLLTGPRPESDPIGRTQTNLQNGRSKLNNEGIAVASGNSHWCHLCRRKTAPHLNNPCSTCSLTYCARCLLRRFRVDVQRSTVAQWVCPRCDGYCDCPSCRQKRINSTSGGPSSGPLLEGIPTNTLPNPSIGSLRGPSPRDFIGTGEGTYFSRTGGPWIDDIPYYPCLGPPGGYHNAAEWIVKSGDNPHDQTSDIATLLGEDLSDATLFPLSPSSQSLTSPEKPNPELLLDNSAPPYAFNAHSLPQIDPYDEASRYFGMPSSEIDWSGTDHAMDPRYGEEAGLLWRPEPLGGMDVGLGGSMSHQGITHSHSTPVRSGVHVLEEEALADLIKEFIEDP